MKSLTPFILCCALAASLGLPSAAYAAPAAAIVPVRFPGPASAEQLAAMCRLLQVMKMPMVMRSSMARAPNLDQETYEVNQHISQHASDSDLCGAIAPSYARYLSADDADRMAIHYSSSVGRRQVIAMLASEGIIAGEKNPYFTASEMREVREMEATPASKAFIAARSQILAGQRAAIQAWRDQYYIGYQKKIMANLAEIRAADANYKPGDPGGKFTFRRTGLETLDKYGMLIANYNIETINTNRALGNDMERYGMGHLLMKERLVTAGGIGRARDILSKSEERLERYLQDRDRQQATFRERIAGLARNKQTLAAFEPNLAHQYDQLVRFGENQRALMDVYKRTIDFAESRLGAIQIKDNRMVFNEDADLQVFNALMDQVRKLGDEEAALNNEGAQRSNAGSAAK